MTSAQASRAMMSSPTLKVIQLPSPTTGNVSPVDGIGLVMIARPWESAGLGRNTAVPAAAKAPRRLRRLRCSRFRIEMLFSEAAALEAARDHRIIYEANRPKRRRSSTADGNAPNTDAVRPTLQPKRPRVLLVQPERRILERV